MEWCFLFIVLGIDLCISLYKKLGNADVSSEDRAVQWCLRVHILRVDISLHTRLFLSILIEKLDNFVSVMISNGLEKQVVRLFLQSPPVFPRDDIR